MQALLRKLVEIESPSHDKEAVNRVGALVAEECQKLGGQVEIIPNHATGNHILARFAGQDKNAKPVLILCHMDTVFPLGTLADFPYQEKQNRIHGPGVLDMKSGIVISLHGIASVLMDGRAAPRPITALFTSDEEIGSHTSRAIIEDLARESAVAFVMEGALPDESLKLWRKGVGGFKLRVTGRAAHAGGEHQQGRNAIEEMAHHVIAIQKMTDYEKNTTLSVGVIRGGTTSNVVPEQAEIEVDVRVTIAGEWERIEGEMRSLRPVLEGTRLEFEGALNRPPLPYNEVNQAAFEKAALIAREKLGLELKKGGSGGGSDGNFIAPLGVPVLDGMGAIGEGYHSEREYILASSLVERVQLLETLLRHW